MEAPVKLPRGTWVPGVSGERPDDAWLKELAPDMLVQVGVLLFERGQGFEAHEAWEVAWREIKREGRADEERVLRALIKLAAAMVKVRQGVERGVRAHARGARELLETVDVDVVLGVVVEPLRAMARRVEEDPLPDAALPVGQPMFGRVPRAPVAPR